MDQGQRIMNIKNLAFMALLGLTFSAHAGQRVDFSICESGSSCKKCIERATVEFSPNQQAKKVAVRGLNTEGKPVDAELTDCQFLTATEWACQDGKNRWEGTKDGIKLTQARRTKFNGVVYEACLSKAN